jgi:hypothetical protein
MNTIAEELRAGPNSGDPLFEKAADEIERLEAKASQLASTLATRMLDKSKDKEIERLRAALEIIAGRRQCLDNLMGNMDVACAALDEKP